MTAIWHENQLGVLGFAPSFSFQDVAEICAPAPLSQQEASARLRRWERRLGSAWYAHNAFLARQFYEKKRPFWLTVC